MIISSVNRIIYNGDGEATEFSYPFKIIDVSDIKVMLIDADGNKNILVSDYYVDKNASKVYYPGYAPGAAEASIDTPPILPYGAKLVIYRDVPITQIAEMPKQWPFDVNEDMHDKSCIIDQQLKDAVDRSLKFDVDFDGDFNPTLPIKPGYGWCVNEEGNAIIPLENPKEVYTETVGVYEDTVADANRIKSEIEAVYNAAVADTTAIKDAADEIKSETSNIYSMAIADTKAIYDQTIADANSIKDATQETYTLAVADTTAIKEQAQAISDNSRAFADLAEKWAQSPTSPDGVVDSKSAKTWAEEISSYLDVAIQAQRYAEALQQMVPVWDAATNYTIGDVVMMPDGSTYRCIANTIGDSPYESFKWVKIQQISNDTFEKDVYGDAMVKLPAAPSSQWDVDENGNVMIKPVLG